MADLYIMCGVPGSGKSTFLKNKINNNNSVIISRDKIRFSIVQPNEPYFSHEEEVLETLWEQINEALSRNKNVFVDQTSLTPRARKYLLDHVQGYNQVHIIWIDENLDTCLQRNKMRYGTRSYVPEESLRNMYNQFIAPSFDEGFTYIFRYNSKDNQITYKRRT